MVDYIAVIGDMKESKLLEERGEIQERLKAALIEVNRAYKKSIAAKFVITLGDEFQGLLNSGEYLLDIIQYIQQVMYPVNIRFGVGIGEITTQIDHKAAIGADGPAYYAARAVVEELKEQEKKLKKQAPDIQIALYQEDDFEIETINTILSMMKVMEASWTDKQRYTIWDMEENGGSQEECASRMETSQSTVARRLADGNYITYERAKNTVEKALRQLGEGRHDD